MDGTTHGGASMDWSLGKARLHTEGRVVITALTPSVYRLKAVTIVSHLTGINEETIYHGC